MIEHILTTGTSGEMRIIDNTDNSDLMTVEIALRSTSLIAIPQLPWTYSINENMESWKSFHFHALVGFPIPWQRIGIIFVGNADTFTFHLGNTNTVELNGPTNHGIYLYGGSGFGEGSQLVNVKIDGLWKKATPYVKHDGVWKVAQPYVKSEGLWKTIV